MEAGDAPRSDAERRQPVRRSARGACQRGPLRRHKRGLLVALYLRRGGRGAKRAPTRAGPRAPARSWRWPAGFPSDPS